MSKLFHLLTTTFGIQNYSKAQIGVFSILNGKTGSVEKLGTRNANTKCAGECTCRCCK